MAAFSLIAIMQGKIFSNNTFQFWEAWSCQPRIVYLDKWRWNKNILVKGKKLGELTANKPS